MSKNQSELLYDWQFTANYSAHRDSRPAFLFQLNTCGYNPYATFSLTGGWVCRLQLLLVFANTVILISESRGNHDHIFAVSDSTPPTWGARFPYLYPPGIGWPSYTPGHWVQFSQPPTTRRTTVEVFEPTSTQKLPTFALTTY
jgi:hypothetical protein